MKITTRLTVAGQPAPLVSHDVVLDLCASGRAALTAEGQAEKGQLVLLDIGYGDALRRWFTGYVYDVQPAATGSVQLLCKELTGLLAAPCPVSLQHPTLRSLLAWLTEQRGLTFMLPAADYTDRPIATFTNAGTGYQLLDSALRAFAVPDALWYQQPDGTVFVGSHADSRWVGREVEIDPAWSSRQAGDQLTLPPIPAMRPGATVSGKRVTRVRLKDGEMTLTTATPGKAIKSIDRRRVEDAFPELAARLHLPLLGRVEAISDQAQAGQRNDPFRPRYAVDVQLLGEDGEPDLAIPLYRAVPLPVTFGGPEQGALQFPLEGTLVELGFAFGRADRPFIRTILGQGWTLPDIAPGEQLHQQRTEVFHRIDAVGNQTRATDRCQHDQARQLHQLADDYQGTFGQHQLSTKQHSVECIGAMKRIEALGAIALLAGDDLTLGCLGHLSLTAAGDLVEVVGQRRHTVTGEHQRMEAPRTWIGSEDTNLFALLQGLMDVTTQLTATLAEHTHDGPPPAQALQLSQYREQLATLHDQLTPLIE